MGGRAVYGGWAFAGEHRTGHARPLPPRPIFLLAKRPALLYNKSTNKQEGTP